MLMQLGSVVFEVEPVNTDLTDHDVVGGFVHHPTVGARPPVEAVGEGPERRRILGKLFPHKFDGALAGLEELQAMCKAQEAQFLMRGDGVPMGWVVIDHVRERARYLDATGVGRVIEFEVTVWHADAPSAGGVFNALWRLFQ